MMGRTLQRLTPSRPLRLALLAFVAMLVLAAAILTNEGAQAQIMKPVGASGNTQSADKCPGSTFLVGFMVRYGDWLNAIGIICAPVRAAIPARKCPSPRRCAAAQAVHSLRPSHAHPTRSPWACSSISRATAGACAGLISIANPQPRTIYRLSASA